ncbi:MAG: VWA domain-containing protein [Candidatus Pacebacteria bacterium]|nr:VWA domain-containing protein [Candidatus Paceibacterota bacterium]
MKILNKKLSFLAVLFLFSFAIAQTSFAIATRDEMMSIAESYKTYVWTPTEDNICHNKCCIKWDKKGECVKEIACIVNTPDRNTYKTWTEERGWKAEKEKDENEEETDVWKETISIPYQRGGCSSIEIDGIDLRLKEMKGYGDFEEGVENRKCAGDARYGNRSSHAVGIDCSGFVSRSWNLNPRESTWSLPKISRKLDEYDDLKRGDLLNVKGSHAMLFNKFIDSEIPHKNLEVSESMGYYWKVRDSKYDIENELKRDGYIPYTYFKTMDVDLVIDRSGSMIGFPMIFAKSAAKQFVDYMQTGHKIGVTSFADNAVVDYPLTEIEKSRPSVVKWEIRNAIDNIQAWGMTSVGAGLQEGHNQLKTLGTKDSEKAIILMSDGWENTPPWVADVINGIEKDKIKVCTVGLGFNSDMELLNNLAQQTGCVYKFAATSEALQEIYQDLWSEISGEDTIIKIKEKIKPQETITKFAYLDSSMHNVTFSLSWPGSNIDLTLVDPNGKEINHNTSDSDIEFTEGDTYEFYRIENPTHGQWQLKFYGENVPTEGEPFVFTLSGINGLIFGANLNKPEYIQGEEITITAFAQDPVVDSDDPQYVASASFSVEATTPAQTVFTLQLYDDGNHNDGGANDGIYANTFDNTQESGSYTFNIKASGNTNRAGDPFTREKSISTFVAENLPPVADANGPYSGYAGIKIIFDAIGSTDPENQPLKYRWDFNNDNIFETDWLINSTTEYTYYNSYTGEILLEVSDGISSDTDTAIVEVEIKSAKQLKEETVESLERAKTGDKKVDKKIDDVIKNIKKSLKDDLWEDEIHLNPKKGNKVFVSERTAIARMELYLNRQELSGDVFEEVIKDLVLADKIIAQVILSEAKSTFVKSEKQQKNFEEMISKAEKEIEQAWEYENSNPAKAVRYYWQSWKYSQGAIQEAEK